MTAERIAERGVCEVHDVELVERRDHREEHRRDDGEVLRHVVRDRERGEGSAGDQQLLADLDDLDELGRVGVEVDHVPGLLGGLRAGVHGDADVGLGERGRVVGAVAGHGDEPPAGLLAADQRHLVLGRGFGEEVVDAGFVGDGRRGERVVAGDHHRADAHESQLVEALAHALLDDVLELDHAEHARTAVVGVGDDQRRAALGRDAVRDGVHRLRDRATEVLHPAAHGVGGALADLSAVDVDAAHARLRGERQRARVRRLRRRQPVLRLGERPRSTALRASRRRGSTSSAASRGRAPVTPGTGMNAVA